MIFFRIFPALALITLALTAFSVLCASHTFRITARFAVSFFLAIKQCRIIFQKSLNQKLASAADRVVEVVYGIPVLLKPSALGLAAIGSDFIRRECQGE